MLHLRPQHDAVQRCRSSRMRTVIDAWADRTAAIVRAARRRAGLLLREPGRGDRRHPGPSARSDLRLSVRHPEDRRRDPLRPRLPGIDRRQPVRGPAERRIGRRFAHRQPERLLGGVRAVRGPLARRGPPVSAPSGQGPSRAGREGTRRPRGAVPRRHPQDGRRLRRHPAGHHRGAPGTRPRRTGRLPAASRGVHHPACRRQVEVPRRIGISNGSIRERHHPGNRRQPGCATCRRWLDEGAGGRRRRLHRFRRHPAVAGRGH